MQPFSDEEFLDFTETLSDVFADNYLAGNQLWHWRNEREAMRAWRYAPVPEDCQIMTPASNGKEEVFSVFACRDESNDICYTLELGGLQCLNFDSLEELISVMVGVVKSFKLSAKYSEVA